LRNRSDRLSAGRRRGSGLVQAGSVEIAERCPVPLARLDVEGRIVGHGEPVARGVELDGVLDPSRSPICRNV
jgi:hypothetical protein